MMRKKIFIVLFLSFLCYVNAEKGTRNEKVENQKEIKAAAAPKLGATLTVNTVTLSPCKIRATWSCSQCGSTTFDKYVVHWEESDNSSVADSADAKKTDSTYEIDQLMSSKNYSVYVEAVDSAGVTVIDPSKPSRSQTDEGEPIAVSGFKVGDPTDNRIPVSWNNSTNECPIHGFHLVWNGVTNWAVRHAGGEYTTVGKSRTSYTIANLMPDAHYDITIQEQATDLKNGTNSTGQATTLERAASAPPVKAVTLSSSSINVTWEAPSSSNGEITGYNVQWAMEGNDNSAGNENTTENEYNYVITGLIECSDYTITVAAINGAGIGSSNPVTNSTDEEASPAPENLKCSYNETLGQITVTWDLIDTNQTKCPIDHYGIEYRQEILWNGEVTQPKDTLVSDSTYLIANLPPYTQYDIQVSAYTSKNQGNISYCAPIITEEKEPGPPINLVSAKDTVTNTSLTIVWNDPVDKNGALTTYTVTLYNNETEDTIENEVDYIDFTEAFYTCTFSDLIPSVEYTVGISAENGFGPGEEISSEFHLEEYEA